MKTHQLKCDNEPFHAVWDGRKRAEYRNNNRQFEVADKLILVDSTEESRRIACIITHIQTGYGIPDGYAMLSFIVDDRYVLKSNN